MRDEALAPGVHENGWDRTVGMRSLGGDGIGWGGVGPGWGGVCVHGDGDYYWGDGRGDGYGGGEVDGGHQ